MTTLDEIAARADAALTALADYGDGKRGVMSTMIRLTDTAEDAGKLVAALRAVEAVHKKAACCGEADCAGVAECSHCHYNWPCTTIRQIWEALG